MQSIGKSKTKRQLLAEARRAQILDAARVCVIAEGFHKATINRICLEAGMGVGHLYKFFKSKEAIMIALTERDFDDFMHHIMPAEAGSALDVDGLVGRYLDDLPWLLDRGRATLAQEVLAEATRNPAMAALVAQIDERFRGAIMVIMTPLLDSFGENEIEGRLETLLMLTRALATHAALHPEANPESLAVGIEVALRALLSRPLD